MAKNKSVKKKNKKRVVAEKVTPNIVTTGETREPNIVRGPRPVVTKAVEVPETPTIKTEVIETAVGAPAETPTETVQENQENVATETTDNVAPDKNEEEATPEPTHEEKVEGLLQEGFGSIIVNANVLAHDAITSLNATRIMNREITPEDAELEEGQEKITEEKNLNDAVAFAINARHYNVNALLANYFIDNTKSKLRSSIDFTAGANLWSYDSDLGIWKRYTLPEMTKELIAFIAKSFDVKSVQKFSKADFEEIYFLMCAYAQEIDLGFTAGSKVNIDGEIIDLTDLSTCDSSEDLGLAVMFTGITDELVGRIREYIEAGVDIELLDDFLIDAGADVAIEKGYCTIPASVLVEALDEIYENLDEYEGYDDGDEGEDDE